MQTKTAPAKKLVAIGTDQLTAIRAKSAVKKSFQHIKTHLKEHKPRVSSEDLNSSEQNKQNEQKFILELKLNANEKPSAVINALLREHGLPAVPFNGHGGTLIINDFSNFHH